MNIEFLTLVIKQIRANPPTLGMRGSARKLGINPMAHGNHRKLRDDYTEQNNMAFLTQTWSGTAPTIYTTV